MGTPAGEAPIGPCNGAGCERQLKRGDLFWCMADGKTLCIDCYERVPGVSIADDPPADPPPAPLIFDGDLSF